MPDGVLQEPLLRFIYDYICTLQQIMLCLWLEIAGFQSLMGSYFDENGVLWNTQTKCFEMACSWRRKVNFGTYILLSWQKKNHCFTCFLSFSFSSIENYKQMKAVKLFIIYSSFWARVIDLRKAVHKHTLNKSLCLYVYIAIDLQYS